MESITATTLRERLAAGDALTFIDIREAHEHEEGSITDLNIPIADLPSRIDAIREMAAQGDIVVYCRTGSRSLMAQKMLAVQFKLPNVLNLEGGFEAWDKSEG